MLFSEPKIPQCPYVVTRFCQCDPFSALQRAENSSIAPSSMTTSRAGCFQCSSASRKFLNRSRRSASSANSPQPFSALQRAENSSIIQVRCFRLSYSIPFSALQRAENSSIAIWRPSAIAASSLSVLFSEPKIPQFWFTLPTPAASNTFSALQRAENSSISD